MSCVGRYYNILRRKISHYTIRTLKTPVYSRNTIILGIETSCDDTGCAVIDGVGNILGESLYSQNDLHVRFGGVNPLVAHDLHRENIEAAVTDALEKANLTLKDVDAIAVTTRPGLLVSLQVGVKYAKFLAMTHNKPTIPIHHMEAHALLPRMYSNIPFPFLVLLISGGDAILAIAKDIDEFMLLGKTLDNAPGEILDKAARRLKLRNMAAYSRMAGGKAIELAAKQATCPEQFEFTAPLLRNRDCNFSFSGLRESLISKLLKKEEEHGIIGDGIIPEVNDLCAAFQLAVAEHILHRTERAILFSEKNSLISDKNIVVSGGVACNEFIFNSLVLLGKKLGYGIHRPPPKLCTDNGVMIAWNGIEKLRKSPSFITHLDLKDIDPDAPLGINLVDEVKSANLVTRVTRLKKLSL